MNIPVFPPPLLRINGLHSYNGFSIVSFCRHAEHALMSLPEEPTEESKVTNKERFLASFSMLFTKQEANDLAEKFSLSRKQCKYFLDKLVAKSIGTS